MAATIKNAPAEEPVTLAEAKIHLYEDDADQNDYIESLIIAARQTAEIFTKRQLVTATWYLYLDCFPGNIGIIRPPWPTLQSVSSITYYDTAGDLQTLSDDDYQVDIKTEPGRILPEPALIWPSTKADKANAVIVEFVSGYGDADAVPNTIKQAILLLVGHWFEHREEVIVGTSSAEMPVAAKALLGQHEVYTFS